MRLPSAAQSGLLATFRMLGRLRSLLRPLRRRLLHSVAITFAANNHRVEVVRPDGSIGYEVKRDAERANPRPAGVAARPWRKRVPVPPREPVAVEDAPLVALNPRRAATLESLARKRKRRMQERVAADLVVRNVLADHAAASTARAQARSPTPKRVKRVASRLAAALASEPLATGDAAESAGGSASVRESPSLGVAATDANCGPLSEPRSCMTEPRASGSAASSVALAPAPGAPVDRARVPASARARPSLSLADLVQMHSRAYSGARRGPLPRRH